MLVYAIGSLAHEFADGSILVDVSSGAMASRSKQPPSKLLRCLSGIGGVSDRSLAKILTFVKEHPEVQRTCVARTQAAER